MQGGGDGSGAAQGGVRVFEKHERHAVARIPADHVVDAGSGQPLERFAGKRVQTGFLTRLLLIGKQGEPHDVQEQRMGSDGGQQGFGGHRDTFTGCLCDSLRKDILPQVSREEMREMPDVYSCYNNGVGSEAVSRPDTPEPAPRSTRRSPVLLDQRLRRRRCGIVPRALKPGARQHQ